MDSHTATTFKRYACDKCRQQKLRCTRSLSAPHNNSCDRCIRLGCFCVTSNGRPLGRPPLHTRLPSSQGNYGSGSSQVSDDRRRVRRQVLPAIDTSAAGAEPLRAASRNGDDASAASGMNASDTTTLVADGPTQFKEANDMALDESEFLYESISSASFHSQFDTTTAAELDFGILHDMDEILETTPVLPRDVEDQVGGSRGRQQAAPDPVNGEWMACLISAVGGISRQLADLKSQAWETWTPGSMDAILDEVCPSEFACRGTVEANPLASTLGVATRMTMVLQIIAPVPSSTPRLHCSSPSLSLTLMLLSTYIQFAQLLEIILTRIRDLLQKDAASNQIVPAGHSIMMATCIFEHQLRSLENLIGLPSECRVWTRQLHSCPGILEQQESAAIAQAVTGQAQETFRSLKRTIDQIHAMVNRPGALLHDLAK
ncbi:hypothetical protein B0I35DRAFT_507916 [Stachybotrys elegans]|uniref:Zn(2)-C6 fungal-type domain-containing protein n=1 Tax=Stachybotrys elegans TaxID=80388 RepID=A0A8K0T9C8_9HYPO|nr:hypothetical protein B0I35DRAFT_507916 [Stachybotrys elegans]